MVMFSPMFQHRAACIERRPSRVESRESKSRRLKGQGLKSCNMFQHRAACTESGRSSVESQSLKGFTMFQHRAA